MVLLAFCTVARASSAWDGAPTRARRIVRAVGYSRCSLGVHFPSTSRAACSSGVPPVSPLPREPPGPPVTQPPCTPHRSHRVARARPVQIGHTFAISPRRRDRRRLPVGSWECFARARSAASTSGTSPRSVLALIGAIVGARVLRDRPTGRSSAAPIDVLQDLQRRDQPAGGIAGGSSSPTADAEHHYRFLQTMDAASSVSPPGVILGGSAPHHRRPPREADQLVPRVPVQEAGCRTSTARANVSASSLQQPGAQGDAQVRRADTTLRPARLGTARVPRRALRLHLHDPLFLFLTLARTGACGGGVMICTWGFGTSAFAVLDRQPSASKAHYGLTESVSPPDRLRSAALVLIRWIPGRRGTGSRHRGSPRPAADHGVSHAPIHRLDPPNPSSPRHSCGRFALRRRSL